MYAVWKSKHMVKMAKFQTKSNIFAGLMLPYQKKTGKVVSAVTKTEKKESAPHTAIEKKKELKTAILGGGDVAFPLLFAGVVLKSTGSFINSCIHNHNCTVSTSVLREKRYILPCNAFYICRLCSWLSYHACFLSLGFGVREQVKSPLP